jgi:hypothetical protein
MDRNGLLVFLGFGFFKFYLGLDYVFVFGFLWFGCFWFYLGLNLFLLLVNWMWQHKKKTWFF